jgi:hypothetical protein
VAEFESASKTLARSWLGLWIVPGRQRTKTAKAQPKQGDDFSPTELARHVERLHGIAARFLESVEVKETHDGRTVWEGAVRVFDITGHQSGATRAYAWSYPTDGGKRRVTAVLGVSPVDDAATAVRTMILAQFREAERAKN